MKSKLLPLILILSVLIFHSCKKDKEEASYMKCTINDDQWEANSIWGELSSDNDEYIVHGQINHLSNHRAFKIYVYGARTGTKLQSLNECKIIFTEFADSEPGSNSYYVSTSATVVFDGSFKKATFEAELFPNGNTSGNQLIVKHGEFYVSEVFSFN